MYNVCVVKLATIKLDYHKYGATWSGWVMV